MSAKDIILSIIIIGVFITMIIMNIMSGGKNHIKDNWPKYRCNPVIMPFAKHFGYDVDENFSYCVQNMQKNYMGHLLKPVNYNLSVINDTGTGLLNTIHRIRAMISNIRGFAGSIIQSVFGVFFNVVIEFQKFIIIIKDMMSKLVGIVAAFVYVIDSTSQSIQSAIPLFENIL